MLHSSDFDHARHKIGFKKEKRTLKLPFRRCFIFLFMLFFPQHRSSYPFIYIPAFMAVFQGKCNRLCGIVEIKIVGYAVTRINFTAIYATMLQALKARSELCNMSPQSLLRRKSPTKTVLRVSIFSATLLH